MISAKAIVARLKADSTVNTPTGGRIWPKIAPEASASYPRIIYTGENADTGHAYSGPDGLAKQKVTLACEGLSYAVAAELADAVRVSLDGLSRGTYGGVTVQGCFFEDDRDEQYVEDGTGEQRLIYATELDFTIWFET